jgi:hypothetical protein
MTDILIPEHRYLRSENVNPEWRPGGFTAPFARMRFGWQQGEAALDRKARDPGTPSLPPYLPAPSPRGQGRSSGFGSGQVAAWVASFRVRRGRGRSSGPARQHSCPIAASRSAARSDDRGRVPFHRCPFENPATSNGALVAAGRELPPADDGRAAKVGHRPQPPAGTTRPSPIRPTASASTNSRLHADPTTGVLPASRRAGSAAGTATEHRHDDRQGAHPAPNETIIWRPAPAADRTPGRGARLRG